MPPEALGAAEANRWFVIVAEDLRCAALDLDATPPALEDALFHCQQAVEKALKGFLTFHGRPFRKVHDLHELGEQCVMIDVTLEDLLRRASSMSKFQVMHRYPLDEPEPSLQDTKAALALAREVVEVVLSRLPPEVRA